MLSPSVAPQCAGTESTLHLSSSHWGDSSASPQFCRDRHAETHAEDKMGNIMSKDGRSFVK